MNGRKIDHLMVVTMKLEAISRRALILASHAEGWPHLVFEKETLVDLAKAAHSLCLLIRSERLSAGDLMRLRIEFDRQVSARISRKPSDVFFYDGLALLSMVKNAENYAREFVPAARSGASPRDDAKV